jgi:hypothetical protein
MEQLLTQQKFPASLQDNVSGLTHFSFWGHHWPARSPDHAVSNYFLWRYIKSKVNETHPAKIADLKQ